MSITTFGELKTAIQKWLDYTDGGTDLVNSIPDFITLAESELRSDLDDRVMMERTTPAVLSSNTLPTDYGSPIVVKLYSADTDEEMGELRYATENDITRWKARGGDGGAPTHYTITNNVIEFFPSADDSYKWGMTYYAHPVLDQASESSTNNLLRDWPGLYLYGSLLHSAPFLDEDPRMMTWQARYDTAVMKANTHADESQMGTAQISMPEGASW